MKNYSAYVGTSFGRLTIESVVIQKQRQHFKARCLCGKIAYPRPNRVLSSLVKSCGCLSRDKFRVRLVRHGLSKTPEYEIWCGIIARCYNPNTRHYKYYGGRGIKMSESWRNDFAAFWRDMGARPVGNIRMTIERNDNDGDYTKENCRWATFAEQSLNKETMNVPRGEKHKRAVLTDSLVRTLRSEKGLCSKIARRHNLSHGCVYAVITGRTWRHVL